MASRTAPKPGRTQPKNAPKTPGKDQGKGDKQPANVLEIVPGKFNETDWLSLLENDDTEDFIADLFESIWAETSKQIEQIYIRRQLLPFTLMMTENALSNVIQWAFLERDDVQPADGDFWTEDTEPIPCTMDNWGEGVVPACREERATNAESMPLPTTDEYFAGDLVENSPRSTNSSMDHAETGSRPVSRRKQLEQVQKSNSQHLTQDLTRSQSEHITAKPSPRQAAATQRSLERKPFNHDVLVIETSPPKLEPLAPLFHPSPGRITDSSSPNPTPATSIVRRRRVIGPKGPSQLDSDELASTTNATETTITKALKKHESKLFDDQKIEEVVAKAPVAAHAILKSILSRPPGYRELELDEFGNVIAIAKIDPDKLGPRSVRVKCDVVKPRKPALEARPAPPKQPQMIKASRSDPRFAPVKLVLPEHSTEVGDLIQPVPGVLYEDSKLKKGDPRRYQTGLSKYTNFYDESRPLRPIARRTDLAVIQVANDLLRISKEYQDDDDRESNDSIPKLPRLSRIPPIMSRSSTSPV